MRAPLCSALRLLVVGLLVGAGVSRAATPVLLPQGADPRAWADALMLAGLVAGPPGDGAWVVVSEQDDGWWVVVRGVDGTVRRAQVARPVDADGRTSMAFLMASMLRPVAVPMVATSPEPLPPEPKAAPPRRPPPPPPPEVAPVVEPEPVVVAPADAVPPPVVAPRQGHLRLAASAGARTGTGHAVQAALGGVVTWAGPGGLLLEVRADGAPSAPLPVAGSGRGGAGLAGAVFAGVSTGLGLEAGAGGGAAARWFSEDGRAVGSGVVPVAVVAVGWRLEAETTLVARPTVWATRDLRPTVLSLDDDRAATLSPWAGGLVLDVGWRVGERP